MIDKTTLDSAQALIDDYVAGLQTLTGDDKAEQAQTKARELESKLAAMGIFSPDDLSVARKNIERQDYHSRLLNGVWETSKTITPTDLGTLNRDQSKSARNGIFDLSDTITYHFYSYPNYVLTAAANSEGSDTANRALSKGVEISSGSNRNLKHSLLCPPTKHVFRMVSSGFSDTISMRDSFLSLLTIALHNLGVELEIYPDSNNLKVGVAKIGLMEMSTKSITGVEYLKFWESKTIQTAVIGLSINEEYDNELAKYVFGDEGLKITGIKQLIGGVSPQTMFSALSAARG